MCGILIAKGIDVNVARELMSNLEKTRGGDGNGFVIIDKRKKMKKGIGLKIDEICQELKKHPNSLFIFHTRMASYGKIMGELCQPFKINNGYVVHNGTWPEFIIDYLICNHLIPEYANDSYTLAYLIQQFGPEVLKKIYGVGVVVYYDTRRKLFHVKNEGSSLYYNETYKCLVSYPYEIISAEEVEYGYQVFGLGDKPRCKKENKATVRYYYHSKRCNDYTIEGFACDDGKRGNSMDIGNDGGSNEIFCDL